MSHEIVASVGSKQIEVVIALLGGVFGSIVGLAWANHREISTLMLGFALALTLGQSMGPWVESYIWLVEYRPLAAKPWYFLVPMFIAIQVFIPLHTSIRTRHLQEIIRRHIR
jgi:hypothetical protein